MGLIPTKKQYSTWSIPSKLTFWSFIIGVFGIIMTIFISLMDILILKEVSKKLDYKIVLKFRSVIESLDKTTYTGNNFDYWPESGIRNAYYRLASKITYNEIQQIFGGNIFVKGPHFTNNLNLTDKTQFGHYNMDFLDWVDSHLTEALEDSEFINRTQPIFDNQLDFIVTHYAIVKLYLDKNIKLKNKLLNDYKTHIENNTLPDGYIEQVSWVKFFSPKYDIENVFPSIKEMNNDSIDLTSLRSLFKGKENLRRDNRHVLEKDEQVRKKLQHLMDFGNPNVIAPAIYFWLRRNIDGSEEKIFSILKKIILKYDAADYHGYSSVVLYDVSK